MEAYDEKSQTYIAHRRIFQEFLSNDVDEIYARRITHMLEHQETRLIVNLDDFRKFNSEVARLILLHPMQYIAPFQSALKEHILARGNQPETEADGISKVNQNYTIGIEGNFGALKVSPRQLSANHLGQLVCVEGIATRCSIVRPKVQKTVHYCEKTGVHSEMTYHDSTSITGFPTSSIYPTKDLEGNPLTTEFGLSNYEDHQTLVIQEMPERAPAGLLPSSVDVVMDDDLVDQCKPGDRVAIIGIYRALPSKSQGSTSGIFKSILIANHVRHLGKTIGSASPITAGDATNIRKISRRQDVFELLGRSVAPSIFGHEYIKRALVLLLLGGVEKNLENGTHIRGDINMLFVGDPSTAKSQLLRFILNIAPLALNTTGRGSSGVGLTAAVTQDKETGERRLEAGAMVLADRGVVCIDEFDKMSDADRVAIHEVMEQQTVTIAKAGIHMSLNARCSVVAAANPRYSQYDSTKPPNWNVNLPDSLLSRFDFLFIILDTPDPENDRAIADKVLSNHRYQRKTDETEEEVVDYNAGNQDAGTGEDTEVYQKFDKLLHSGLIKSARRAGRTKPLEILSVPFLKKYLEFAKAQEPILTPEAADFIGKAYADLRHTAAESENKDRSGPITARTLETLIRLSTAHAKSRLDDQVTVHDCEAVIAILRYAIDHDTSSSARDAPSAEAEPADEEDEDGENSTHHGGDDDDQDMDGGDEAPRSGRGQSKPSPKKQRSPSKRKQPSKDASPSKRAKGAKGRKVIREEDEDEDYGAQQQDEDVEMEEEKSEAAAPSTSLAARSTAATAAPTLTKDSPRVIEVRSFIVGEFKKLRAESLSYKSVFANINKITPTPFQPDEFDRILKFLEQQDAIMWRAGDIHKI